MSTIIENQVLVGVYSYNSRGEIIKWKKYESNNLGGINNLGNCFVEACNF